MNHPVFLSPCWRGIPSISILRDPSYSILSVSIHKVMNTSISIQWSLLFPYCFGANPSISIQSNNFKKTFSGSRLYLHISKVGRSLSCIQGFYSNILPRTVKFSVRGGLPNFLKQLKFFFCTNKLTTTHSVSLVKIVLYFPSLELLFDFPAHAFGMLK